MNTNIGDLRLKKYVKSKRISEGSKIIEVSISYESLREKLAFSSKIIEEDKLNGCLVVSIKSGWMNRNYSVAAVHTDEKRVLIKAIANEGIINQKSANKAIRIIERVFNE